MSRTSDKDCQKMKISTSVYYTLCFKIQYIFNNILLVVTAIHLYSIITVYSNNDNNNAVCRVLFSVLIWYIVPESCSSQPPFTYYTHIIIVTLTFDFDKSTVYTDTMSFNHILYIIMNCESIMIHVHGYTTRWNVWNVYTI